MVLEFCPKSDLLERGLVTLPVSGQFLALGTAERPFAVSHKP